MIDRNVGLWLVLVTCVSAAAQPARADTSSWSGRVGTVGLDDKTTWCTPSLKSSGGRAYAESVLSLVSLDGTVVSPVTNLLAQQRVKLQCFANANLTGASTTVTSAWSTDGAGDIVQTALCPAAQPFGGYLRCQVTTGLLPPWVYAGTNCGNGVTDLSASSQLKGQLTGAFVEVHPTVPAVPLFNNTSSQAAIGGTDLGYSFLAQGNLYFGFGDSWENDFNFPGLWGFRGSVLARTTDFDPSDANGIAFQSWETVPFVPTVAREIVPSPHDYSGNTEITAIATSGFGLTEGATTFRFVWFDAIKRWNPSFVANESTLAWSVNNGAFVRGDQQPLFHAPRWPWTSYMGPGAIWVDRENGYIYFFGVRTYVGGNPVRLARVRAVSSLVVNHLEYEYWTGAAWQKPSAANEYALANLAGPAPDLIPASRNARPEMSVAYDSYAGRFVMLIHNDTDLFTDPGFNNFELWQAPAVTGPWTQVVGATAKLPSLANLYGAYMSEHTMRSGGQDIYFAMSEWDVTGLQPYNVGLWKASLSRNTITGCVP